MSRGRLILATTLVGLILIGLLLVRQFRPRSKSVFDAESDTTLAPTLATPTPTRPSVATTALETRLLLDVIASSFIGSPRRWWRRQMQRVVDRAEHPRAVGVAMLERDDDFVAHFGHPGHAVA